MCFKGLIYGLFLLRETKIMKKVLLAIALISSFSVSAKMADIKCGDGYSFTSVDLSQAKVYEIQTDGVDQIKRKWRFVEGSTKTIIAHYSVTKDLYVNVFLPNSQRVLLKKTNCRIFGEIK